MNNRRVIVRLLAVAALLIGAHVLLSLRDGEAVRLLPRRALAEEAFSAREIIVGHPGTASVTKLRRDDTGWRIVAPYAASVEHAVLQKFLDVFAFAPIEDRMGDSELLKLGRTRADYGLESPRPTVVLSNANDEVSVFFGAAKPDGSGVYAAVTGDDSVFLVASNVFAAVNLSAGDFRRRALVTDASAEVSAFDLRCGTSAPLRFVRESGGWSLLDSSSPVAAGSVQALLRDVLAAEAVGFTWPVGATNEPKDVSQALLAGYGLDSESAVTATFKLSDGTDRFVSFGKEAGEGLVYALAQNGCAIVTLPAALRAAAAADASTFTDMRIFPHEAASVTVVSVVDGETRGLLARAADGTWRLDAPVSAPADAAVAEAFVARILSLKAADRDANGPVVAVGTNGTAVAVSRTALFGDLRLADLRSKTLADIAAAEVRRLVVMRNGSRTSLAYDRESDRWSVEGGDGKLVPDRDALASVLKAFRPLAASRVVEIRVAASDLPRYGLSEPWLSVAVDLAREEDLRRNIRVGDRTDGGAYATVGASDAVFVIPDTTVRTLAAPLAVAP